MKLNKLIIQNFKGIKTLEIDFKDITNISGANRVGKSRVFDAFLWLLFGKNAEGDTKFSIKSLDGNNKTTPKQEVDVFALLTSGDSELKLRRTLREKWNKRRGESVPMFTGNETAYEWNDIPIQQKDFQKRINDVINEDYFKLLTNPLYFNSLNWEKRRGMLENLIPKMSIDPKFDKLTGMEYEDLKKSIAGQIKKLKDELKLIPVRIDEVHKGKPETLKFKNIQADLNSKIRSLESIEEKIINKNKVLIEYNDSKITDQLIINDLKVELENYKSDFETKNNIERRNIEKKIQENGNEADKCKSNIKTLEEKIESLATQLEFQTTLREKRLKEWHEVNGKIFVAENEICEECGQDLPQSDINLREKGFDEHKELRLDGINKVGKKAAFRMGELEQKIKTGEGDKSVYDIELLDLNIKKNYLESELGKIKKPDITHDEKYCTLHDNYALLRQELDSVKPPTIDDSELKAQKNDLNTLIDRLKKQLEAKTVILTAENRIKDLETQTINKAAILLDLENKEFEMDEFNRAKMTALESEINKKFQFVKFKMFESQINGGEKEVCTTLINGVPFADANTEGRLNAGLDIINVFSKHYNISAPIFIDAREGVTDIIPVKAQIINLIVNPEFKTLKIS